MKDPHDTLHIVLIHRAIRSIHIDPATDLIDIPFPLCTRRLCILVASVDEFFHTSLFDLFIRGESEFFLDFLFDRETMAVPSPDTFDPLATHGPVSPDDIFHDRRQERPIVRRSGDKGWTIVETVWIILGTRIDRLLEDAIRFPECEDL